MNQYNNYQFYPKLVVPESFDNRLANIGMFSFLFYFCFSYFNFEIVLETITFRFLPFSFYVLGKVSIRLGNIFLTIRNINK